MSTFLCEIYVCEIYINKFQKSLLLIAYFPAISNGNKILIAPTYAPKGQGIPAVIQTKNPIIAQTKLDRLIIKFQKTELDSNSVF